MVQLVVLPSRHFVVGADDEMAQFIVKVSPTWGFGAMCMQDTPLDVIRLRVSEALEVPETLIGLVDEQTNQVIDGGESLGHDGRIMRVRWSVDSSEGHSWGLPTVEQDLVLKGSYKIYFRPPTTSRPFPIDKLSTIEGGFRNCFPSGIQRPVTFGSPSHDWLPCRVKTNNLMGELIVHVNRFWEIRDVMAELYKTYLPGVDPGFMILKKSGTSDQLGINATVVETIFDDNAIVTLELEFNVGLMDAIVQEHQYLNYFPRVDLV